MHQHSQHSLRFNGWHNRKHSVKCHTHYTTSSSYCYRSLLSQFKRLRVENLETHGWRLEKQRIDSEILDNHCIDEMAYHDSNNSFSSWLLNVLDSTFAKDFCFLVLSYHSRQASGIEERQLSSISKWNTCFHLPIFDASIDWLCIRMPYKDRNKHLPCKHSYGIRGKSKVSKT